MKTFVEKTKYEQRQALLDLIQDYSTMSKPNRPVFLNKIHGKSFKGSVDLCL